MFTFLLGTIAGIWLATNYSETLEKFRPKKYRIVRLGDKYAVRIGYIEIFGFGYEYADMSGHTDTWFMKQHVHKYCLADLETCREWIRKNTDSGKVVE